MINLAPVPQQQALLDDRDKTVMHPRWIQWLLALVGTVQNVWTALGVTTLTTQSASVGATPIIVTGLAPGDYRVNYFAWITQAATTSSSLIVTMGWTENAVAQTRSFQAMTANTITTTQHGSMTVTVDATTSVTYATTYASTGATAMQYQLTIALEALV